MKISSWEFTKTIQSSSIVYLLYICADSMVCTSGCRYSWTLYSWWWAWVASETCRV